MARGIALWLLGLLCFPLAVQAPSVSSVDEIVRRSTEATHADWEKAPQYDFCETEVAGIHTRTYAELMIAGSAYERLVAIDGKALPEQEEKKQADKFAQTVDERSHESEEQHAKRVAQYQKERHRDQLLLEEMTKAMSYRLEDRTTMSGHQTYVLRATPRSGYQPKSMETQVLTGMSGTLWVDQNSWRWVRVEAEVMHPVNIVGFVARVEPGTHFRMDEAPVREDLWMASRFTMRAKAKILFVFPSSSAEDDTWFHYVPVGQLDPEACIPGGPETRSPAQP